MTDFPIWGFEFKKKKKGLQIRKSYLDKSQTLRENAMEKDLILF